MTSLGAGVQRLIRFPRVIKTGDEEDFDGRRYGRASHGWRRAEVLTESQNLVDS